ncbi:MAG: AmmeMemoRadiSam system protein B [Acidobacteriaceae bacterium]
MLLPRLRTDIDVMVSPVAGRPGLLIRDSFRFSDAVLIIPPLLIPGLRLFDGTRTYHDLEETLARSAGPELAAAAGHLVETLSKSGFLQDENYRGLKQRRLAEFQKAPVRAPAHAGTAYPDQLEPLRTVMQGYLDGAAPTRSGVIGIAAPHVSPPGGWQSYRAAYQELTPDLRDRTFVILGTSHYGPPGKFGLTRKPFQTPFGETIIDCALVDQLEPEPAVVMEDYCHAVEHSIEFQVAFLQFIYGPGVRILPILCGSFARSIHGGGLPEDEEPVKRFFDALAQMAEREKHRVFWVLGVDMAHIGQRFGDRLPARAEQDQMVRVRERDQLRIEHVNAWDAAGFWNLVRENQDDLRWCGSSPIYTFMKAVPWARGDLLRYEQWNIDENSVVSFAGISFHA